MQGSNMAQHAGFGFEAIDTASREALVNILREVRPTSGLHVCPPVPFWPVMLAAQGPPRPLCVHCVRPLARSL